MVVAILADESAKDELMKKGFPEETEIVWADSIASLTIIEADAYFDLLFEYDRERILKIKRLLPQPVFVNSVIHICGDLGAGFIRINGWPTMIGRNVAEIAHSGNDNHIKNILKQLGWLYSRSPDIPGMITPRIVSMIVNEAWYALGENVSTREEIDTAMKLGTNYPYGPFEWGEKIGFGRIRSLLAELAKTDARYTVAPGLNELQWL
ncbi:MAG: hypothetical protein JNK79_18240 [Chitinophagaceae bacterium]|nr:hypothetical protein [Chitinophagaceae bacterium]